MGYEELMALPIRAFWFMNAQIERIRAQADMRSLDTAMAANSVNTETAVSYREKLVLEVGEVVKGSKDPLDPMNAMRDEAGFAALRAMAGEKIGR